MSILTSTSGGERQLIISLMGRQSTAHMMPVSLFQESMDVSDREYAILNFHD